MKRKTIIIASVSVIVLLAGAFLGSASLAYAQSAQHSNGEILEKVAEALGVTVEELQSAIQNARPAECADLERGEKPEGVDCAPNLEAVANELGVTVEELEAAFAAAREEAKLEKLAAAAEQLGVSVEALQSALENARPAECLTEERPEGVNCRPNFESVAEELGVTIGELQSALGRGGRGVYLGNVAETLGVTAEALQEALEDARPDECTDAQSGEKPEGVNCRPNLEAAAEALGVDVEELQNALQNERGPRGHGRPNGNEGQPPANP